MQDGNISCHVDNLKRLRPDKSLRSAIETAAYNSRSKLWSGQNEVYADVSHRDDITYEAVIAPESAPDWASDRLEVWNRIDQHAPRRDTRLAKTIMGSIARQIPHDDRIAMLHKLVAPWVAQGVIADVAIHDDGTNHNPHVHVMLTTRVICDDTFGVKIGSVEQRRFVTDTRQRWTELNNVYLKKNGSSLRLDHRSYKARGDGRTPTHHRGPDSRQAYQENNQAEQTRSKAKPEQVTLERQPNRQTQKTSAEPLNSGAEPSIQDEQPLEQVMRNPTDAERRDYPLLTDRDQWPPATTPVQDMSRAERSELRRYWDEHQIEKMEAERLLEAGEPEHNEVARSPERSVEAVSENGVEQVRASVHSNNQHARDLVFEAEFDRAIAERGEQRVRDAVNLHRGILGYTREERELLAQARGTTRQEAKVIHDYIIFKRMEYLQAKENQRLQKDMAKWMAPERVQAIKDRIADQEHEALQAAYERQIDVREAEAQQPVAEADHRAEIVQGPNDEPLHPRERNAAEDQMLIDMERKAVELEDQQLSDHIDHAYATQKMLRDFERNLEEESEQERER